MNELHIGIWFEPWEGGAHIGALKGPPDGQPEPPCTLLPSDTLTIPVYLWWLDNELPDVTTQLEIERVVRGYMERETHPTPSARIPTVRSDRRTRPHEGDDPR